MFPFIKYYNVHLSYFFFRLIKWDLCDSRYSYPGDFGADRRAIVWLLFLVHLDVSVVHFPQQTVQFLFVPPVAV